MGTNKKYETSPKYERFLPPSPPSKVYKQGEPLKTVQPTPYVAQRKSDGKYQVIFASQNTDFNYWTLSDTVDANAESSYSTIALANDFMNSQYIASPANKKYVEHSDVSSASIFGTFERATFTIENVERGRKRLSIFS